MNRNELLHSVGFDTDFIRCLDAFEQTNPELIELDNVFLTNEKKYIDSTNSSINLSKPTFQNTVIIRK